MCSRETVVFVDDETVMLKAAEQWLSLADFKVLACRSAEQALAYLTTDFPGILVTDVKMPGTDGLTLMRQTLSRDKDLPVVLVTGHGDISMAVEAMRDGAYDFIEKPFPPERLTDVVHRACEKRRLVMEVRQLRQQLETNAKISAMIIGNSPAIERLRKVVAQLADADADVLISGETGVGKGLFARFLHDHSSRNAHKFVAINCGAIPEALFESELFGHEGGAFTSAEHRRIGKFEYAQHGTVFLDEIESLPQCLQVKLLRILEERCLERLGSNQVIPLDMRIIAASKGDLKKAVAEGHFRADLYYRLGVAELNIPPLRDRLEDIPLLFEFFVIRAAQRLKREPVPLNPTDLQALMLHSWPGNVRELRNLAERCVLGVEAGQGKIADLLLMPDTRANGCTAGQSLVERLEFFERCTIAHALGRHRGNIALVMEELGLPRRTLNQKMVQHGLNRKDYV